MAQHGGHREGAGRKVAKHTLEAAEQRRMLIERLTPHVAAIVDALAKKAVEGDVQAARELLDRAWGKAPQSLDLSNTDGSLKTIIIQKAK